MPATPNGYFGVNQPRQEPDSCSKCPHYEHVHSTPSLDNDFSKKCNAWGCQCVEYTTLEEEMIDLGL